MALPPLAQPNGIHTIARRKSDGITRPDSQVIEPGCFYEAGLSDVITGHYPQVTQVTDYELTGTDPSTGTWTLTVTPLTTQAGTAAAAHAMQPASVSVVVAADTFDDVVLDLVAAINTSGTVTDLADLASWNRLRSYVTASVSTVDPHKIRLTARSPGATFSAVITSTTAGDSYTATAIASPVTDTLKVGLYYAIDTSKGTNGRDANGRPYLTKITSSTSPANIVGPIFLGSDTKPVERGFAYREYGPGQNIPVVNFGPVAAYGEKAIALANGPEPVYVRHTDAGDYLAGMATDAAGAAAGATPNKWTGTPTETNSVLYVVTVQLGANTALLQYTSDGNAAAAEIVAGLKLELAKYNAAGGILHGITAGSETATLVLNGPADGRAITVITPATSAGVVTWVETTPEVSTHTLLTRGDKLVAPSTRIGPVRTDVPITHNV